MGEAQFGRVLDRLEGEFTRFIIGLGFHFPRSESREVAAGYVRGLLSRVERKNTWQLAEATGQRSPEAYQHLLNRAVWDADALRDEHLSEALANLGNHGVMSIDETGFVKKGTKSAGVKRQYCGCVGKIENCQIGVFLNWKTSKGHTLLDRELYLPEDWAKDQDRRSQAHISKEVEFKTKPELAQRMIARAFALGAQPEWVLGDEVYGKDTQLRFWLEERRQPYVLAVASNQHISIGFKRCAISEVLKTSNLHWNRISAGVGSKGLRLYDWAACKINHPYEEEYQRWALFRRSISNPDEISFYLVFVRTGTTLLEMVEACGSRWSIEEDFESSKGEVGLDQYEVRSYHGWYRHITLCMRAHAFLVQTKASLFPAHPPKAAMRDFKKKRGLHSFASVSRRSAVLSYL